jgi:hypothetical protein
VLVLLLLPPLLLHDMVDDGRLLVLLAVVVAAGSCCSVRHAAVVAVAGGDDAATTTTLRLRLRLRGVRRRAAVAAQLLEGVHHGGGGGHDLLDDGAGAWREGDGPGPVVREGEADERLQLLHLVPEHGQVVEQRVVALRVGGGTGPRSRRLRHEAAAAVHGGIESVAMVEQLLLVLVLVVL